MANKIIVYGTLRKGEPNHYLMATATFLGDVRVPNAVIYDLFGYPGLKFLPIGNENMEVQGELYEVDDDTLKRLDILEGHPNLYKRIKCKYYEDDLDSGNGIDDPVAMIYEYQRSIEDNERIPSGDWLTRDEYV